MLLSFFKSLECIAATFIQFSMCIITYCKHISKNKKGRLSRVNGISDDDYGSNLKLNKTKVTNTSSRRRKAEGSHRIRSRKEREQRELWGWQ